VDARAVVAASGLQRDGIPNGSWLTRILCWRYNGSGFIASAKDDKMNARSSPGNSSGKRAILPGFAVQIFRLLRMFWLTELALLLVVLYGLYAGWSAPRQWSDGLFFAAAVQVMIAGIITVGSARDPTDAFSVRHIANANIADTRHELIVNMLRQRSFGLRAFAGGVLTILIAWLVLRV